MRHRLRHIFVWLRRIGHCRGFGIQSPTDYWLVRYVINEHWPYYQYAALGCTDDWLTRKLGLLYFRIANWRQPSVIESPGGYRDYLAAGCRRAVFGESKELVILSVGSDCRDRLRHLYNKVVDDTVLIIEGIWKDQTLWREVVSHPQTVITFDLYYCGIVMFPSKRHKQHYTINF